MSLKLDNLYISRDGQEIVKGVSLEIAPGQAHALMGPNGSGKSTLANALAGHPKYEITHGQIFIDNEDVTAFSPDHRARRGLFLSMQTPPEIPGVTFGNFLRAARDAQRGDSLSVADFYKLLKEKMAALKIDQDFAGRSLNEGFSGGEKKRAEMLQLAVLEPRYAVLDETDSGLDVDALKIVADGLNRLRPQMGILLITHYARITSLVVPDCVHIMINGQIQQSGGRELAVRIEERGYKDLT